MALAVAIVLAAAVFGLLWLNRYMSTGLRNRAIAMLEDRLESQVDLADLRVSLGPRITLGGSGLVIRHHRRQDVPPLVSIETFSATMSWSDLIARPRRLDLVEIEGLRITTPPREEGSVRSTESGGCQNRSAGDEAADTDPDGAVLAAADKTRPAPGTGEPSPFLIERLTSRNAWLTMLPSNPEKRPREFAIEEVTLRDFALDRPAAFTATLMNPVPRGHIATRGSFGPWNAPEPGATTVQGDYTFSNADLGTIKGIAGVLESTGAFDGPLRQILVKGEAQVEDFGLNTSRNRMPLVTRFEACVDGTDGDTYLDRVDATLQDTPIVAAGKVEGKVGVDGRFITLEVTVDDGRVEDFLRLAVNDAEPLMTGRIDVKSAFVLPPGEGEVVDRLDLDGRFGLQNTRFTEGEVQKKINELSRRGRGDMETDQARAVRSSLDGTFALKNGVLRLSRFSFAVPGAVVQLQGRYGLTSEEIDFNGRVRTEARVSEMTTGFKSALLKVVDPLFARDGSGAIFPISVGGTREKPSFKVDVRRAIFRK